MAAGTKEFKTRIPNIDNFLLKAGIVRDAITQLPSPKILNIVPLVYKPKRRNESDSDNGVDIPDNERVNPFNPVDLQTLNGRYEELHEKYWQAKRVDFQNAFGKFILRISPNNWRAYHSTNSSGTYQQGSLNVTWVTQAPETRTRSNCYVETKQEQIAYFVVL